MKFIELQCVLGQKFGEQYVDYRPLGLSGHSGLDLSCGYGSDIKAYRDGIVYATRRPNETYDYTAVYTLVTTPLEILEVTYGHCSEISVQDNAHVSSGDVLGKEGNYGLVFTLVGSNYVQVTNEMRKAGDRRGSHRHVQFRPVLAVKATKYGDILLQTGHGAYLDQKGYYKHAIRNTLANCVDPLAPIFQKDMIVSPIYRYDVLLLQKALILEGFATFEPTGTFGPLTFASVQRLQRRLGLTPVGVVGPKTRAYLNSQYTR